MCPQPNVPIADDCLRHDVQTNDVHHEMICCVRGGASLLACLEMYHPCKSADEHDEGATRQQSDEGQGDDRGATAAIL